MISETTIPGLLLVDLDVRRDERGWLKESWQQEKMLAAGLPDFGPVQNNLAFNDVVGVTRGIHAEPWDKYVTIGVGKVFGAWVDLREGPTFGTTFTAELDESTAIFVPRGVGNSYQTLVPGTCYAYLVNDHWAPDAVYAFLNLADETVAIDWPIPLAEAHLSDKDKLHPRLADVTPIKPRKVLITGADGQLGRALHTLLGESPHIEYASHADLDITSDLTVARRWRDFGVIINTAAYTAVDAAETTEGRATAWRVNAVASAALARIATEYGITLVHISTDYVFDGASERPYREDDVFVPLSAYGQAKAAGDLAVDTVPRRYILRTSWVVGDGNNFVRTMTRLAARGVDPKVVNDQLGRLTFADDLAGGIRHLLETKAPYGTYNFTGSGETQVWSDVARDVYGLTGHDPERITPVSTAEYFSHATDPVAHRPYNSVLDLTKIESTGYHPRDGRLALREYLASESITAAEFE